MAPRVTSGGPRCQAASVALLLGAVGVALVVGSAGAALSAPPIHHPTKDELFFQRAYQWGWENGRREVAAELEQCKDQLSRTDDVTFAGLSEHSRAEHLAGCLSAVRNAAPYGEAAMRAALDRCTAD